MKTQLEKQVSPMTLFRPGIWLLCLTFGIASAAAQESEQDYLPLEVEGRVIPPTGPGVYLQEDYNAALNGYNLDHAKLRWEAFIRCHKPGSGPGEGYGDRRHIIRVRSGLYELVRVNYLLGDFKAGDKWFRALKKEDPHFVNLYRNLEEELLSDEDSDPADDHYVPLDALAGKPPGYEGEIPDRFTAAAQSIDLETAQSNWESFLELARDDADDITTKVYLRQGLYELARIHYLRGDREAGDAIMLELRQDDAGIRTD